MSIGLTLTGHYLGIDPGDVGHRVYADRTALGSWETIALTRHPEGWYDVRFLVANRQLTITPDGTLESRSAGAIGEWEALLPSANGKTLSRAGVSLTIDGDLAPPTAPTSPLKSNGRDFVTDTGGRRVLCGVDQFLAYRQFLDGGAAALVPLVEESRAIGFDCWRVFMQGSKAQNQVLELKPRDTPGYYDRIRPFVDTLIVNGIVPLLTVFVDNQDVGSPIGHWMAVADRVRGTATLLSGGNQWSKNGFDPWAIPNPEGLIWSRGSDIEDIITDPRGAPASELHATRISIDRALMDSTASPPFMRSHGATMVWMTEGAPWDDGSSPEDAWKLGRGYSIDWSLAVFHNRQSQRGQLLKPGTRRCAEAWVRGMAL